MAGASDAVKKSKINGQNAAGLDVRRYSRRRFFAVKIRIEDGRSAAA